jgi:hypothetical protein
MQVGTRVELASWTKLSVSMLNTTVKNREETERSYVHVDLAPTSGNH